MVEQNYNPQHALSLGRQYAYSGLSLDDLKKRIKGLFCGSVATATNDAINGFADACQHMLEVSQKNLEFNHFHKSKTNE